MPSHRKKITQIHDSAEILTGITDLHRLACRTMATVRIGTPHYEALSRMTDDLSTAYLAISGETEVPWARIGPGFFAGLGARALPGGGPKR